MSLLAKQFGKALRRWDKRSRSCDNYVPSNNYNYMKHPRVSGKKFENEKGIGSSQGFKDKNFRCRECEGFGPYQAECPNFLRRQNKGYTVTLSDDESESSNDSDEEVFALIGCTSLKAPVTFICEDKGKSMMSKSPDDDCVPPPISPLRKSINIGLTTRKLLVFKRRESRNLFKIIFV